MSKKYDFGDYIGELFMVLDIDTWLKSHSTEDANHSSAYYICTSILYLIGSALGIVVLVWMLKLVFIILKSFVTITVIT